VALIVLTVAVTSLGFWKVREPDRNAGRTRAALRPGMSAREIVESARGGFIASIVMPRSPQTGRVGVWRLITSDGRQFEGVDPNGRLLGPGVSREGLSYLLEARAAELALAEKVQISFSALLVPRRVALSVQLDGQGRLSSVGLSRVWD